MVLETQQLVERESEARVTEVVDERIHRRVHDPEEDSDGTDPLPGGIRWHRVLEDGDDNEGNPAQKEETEDSHDHLSAANLMSQCLVRTTCSMVHCTTVWHHTRHLYIRRPEQMYVQRHDDGRLDEKR